MYETTVSLSWQWSFYGAIIIAAIYWFGQNFFIGLLTHLQVIIDLCKLYAPWMAIFPFCASVGLIFYGVFTGISHTIPIRNSIMIALIVYLVAQASLVSSYGNHGLWISFLLFTAGRSVFLVPYILGRKAGIYME